MARAIIVGGGAFDPALMPEKRPGDLLIGADSGCAIRTARSGRCAAHRASSLRKPAAVCPSSR